MTIPGGSASQPPGNKRIGNATQVRSTASAAATLTSASTTYSYADLDERECLASATELQTELSLNHVYMEFLHRTGFYELQNLTVLTDSNDLPDLDDCEDSDSEEDDFETARDEFEEVESLNMESCRCFFQKSLRVNCNVCLIFDEKSIKTPLGESYNVLLNRQCTLLW